MSHPHHPEEHFEPNSPHIDLSPPSLALDKADISPRIGFSQSITSRRQQEMDQQALHEASSIDLKSGREDTIQSSGTRGLVSPCRDAAMGLGR